MVGNNELQLNEATMIEAVQLWVNTNFMKPPQVTAIDLQGSSVYTKTFVVKVDGGGKKEPA